MCECKGAEGNEKEGERRCETKERLTNNDGGDEEGTKGTAREGTA
jgi:hypothetical protein